MTGRVTLFGEVLFDVFAGGEEVLGGAPFNVAWNLRGMGEEPLFVSRVGEDERGERVLEAMRGWGMDTRGIQVDPDHPTGTVEVSLKDGQPRFTIVPDQAYDFIDPDSALSLLREERVALFYHGTLAARSPVSRASLESLRRAGSWPRFVDVNLRPPWWDRESVYAAVSGASWVKINETEVTHVSKVNDGRVARVSEQRPIPGEGVDDPVENLQRAASGLRDELDLSYVVVTLGEKGAFLIERGGDVLSSRAPPVDALEDTVGAGDAFSAVMILGLCRDWPAHLSLERAVEFAASVCRIQGATTVEREHYEAQLRRWKAPRDT